MKIETSAHDGARTPLGLNLFFARLRRRSFDGFRVLRDHIGDLACLNLVLSDAARLARVGVHQGAGSVLELAGAAGGDENVAILAVKLFRGFHCFDVPQRGWVPDAAALKDSKTGRTLSWLLASKQLSARRINLHSSVVG